MRNFSTRQNHQFIRGDPVFDHYAAEADFALHAVRVAAHLCRRIQGEMVTHALAKSDRSPVTVADFASQAVVARMLRDRLPEDILVAEEDSAALRSPEEASTLEAVAAYVADVHPKADNESVCAWIDYGAGTPEGRFWTLDPIDGTKGFLRGDQYVVAIALIDDGQVVLGALGCPNLNQDLRPDIDGEGSALIALRGQGAWSIGLDEETPRRLEVSGRDDPSQARILRSFEAGHTDSAKIDELTLALGTEHPPVLMDSQAKFALLASGAGDLIFRLLSPSQPNYVEKIWDQAAGSIVVEEAGGKVSDLRGMALDFGQGRGLANNIGVLVSNARLHEQALEALRAVGADQRPEGV
jgi:3'(2'), 5'-bisphosphate nucleotidase